MTRPIVLTGGGTGGHLFPMVAIAEALITLGEQPEHVRFVGSRRGQDEHILDALPIARTLLPGRGIRRSMRPQALWANLGAVSGLVVAVVRSLGLVIRWRPRVVVSVGGYASFAVSLAAIVTRRPLVLVDLDATPSATNRLLQRFAAIRCVHFGPASDSAVVTGAPVRQALLNLDRTATARMAARAALPIPIERQRNVVVVMTGSLGASSVNRAIVALAQRWRDRSDIALVHITGRRDASWVVAAAPTPPMALDYRVEEFGDMSVWWAVADVAVCRAGATTVAELTALAIPALLVPLPGAPGDHQTANADALVAAGGALMIADAAVSVDTLEGALSALLTPLTAATMMAASQRISHRDAASAIATTVLSVVRGSQP